MSTATLLRGFDAHVAEIAEIPTRYWVGGSGSPVVLVHGLGGAAINFTELAPLLARRHRVLVADLPGHGGTAPLPAVESLGDLATHVARVAEHEVMLPAAVVGYSMGGVIGLRLAAERPDAVSALALVASAGIVSLTRRARLWLDVVSAVRPGRIAARLRGAVARRPNLRKPIFGYWGADDPRRLSPEAVAGFLAAQPEHQDVESAVAVLRREDPRTHLERVRCPTLLVWGARDRLIPLEDAFEYARRLPAPLRVLPAAGHLLIGEFPEECAALLLDFLETSAA
ncbi:MAG: alpha/beta fold hydrolase [Gaiellaceae bacterium]